MFSVLLGAKYGPALLLPLVFTGVTAANDLCPRKGGTVQLAAKTPQQDTASLVLIVPTNVFINNEGYC